MSTATVSPTRRESKKLTARERRWYLARFRERGWTQNEAARQIGRDQGLFGRWLRGEISSAPIRQQINARLGATEPGRAA